VNGFIVNRDPVSSEDLDNFMSMQFGRCLLRVEHLSSGEKVAREIRIPDYRAPGWAAIGTDSASSAAIQALQRVAQGVMSSLSKEIAPRIAEIDRSSNSWPV